MCGYNVLHQGQGATINANWPNFPDLRPASSGRPLVLILAGSTEASERITSTLALTLAAEVLTGRTVDELAPWIDRCEIIIATDDLAMDVMTALRAAAPSSALVVLTDGSAAADHAVAVADAVAPASASPAQLGAAIGRGLALRAERTGAQRYARLAAELLDSTGSATCVVDRDGTLIAVNRAWLDFAGANGGDPALTGVGANYFAVCQAATGTDAINAAEAWQGLRRLLAGDIDRFELHYSCHAPQEQRWFRLQITPLHEIAGAALAHVDVSADKQTSQALSHLALHDPLTGLPNRHLLHDRVSQALVWSGRVDLPVGVALFDLDQFKRVNDSWGHAAGDELLRSVAVRLQQMSQGTDTTARFADDEFVVVRPGIESLPEAQTWAAQLITAFDEPFPLQDGSVSVAVTASVGLFVGGPPQSADDLLRAVDVAMHSAKQEGRGRTRLYTDELGVGAATRLRTERELRAGIAAGEFALYYQPVIDLTQRRVIGVEALLRWCHEDGIRMPDSFIPIAEESGLIVPLGGWVVGEACRQATGWDVQGLQLEMAVNLSARQLSHADTIATIEAALDDAGLPAQRLLVEVTESAVVEDAEAAQAALSKLAGLGVRIAIDDFGTGYSSLLYLKRYPIQALKVDRTFVSGMGISDDDDAIVASVVSLARAVGAVCIAEGVETEAQHGALLGLGCRYAQGYLFGRPVAADELPNLVEECNARLQLPVSRAGAGRPRRKLAVSAEVVMRIEQLHDAGASLHTIAAALNKEQVPTDHGGRWVSATVARVIASGQQRKS